MTVRHHRYLVTDVISHRDVIARPRPDSVLIDLAERLRRLAPSSRDPERFHEEKSEIVHALRCIAREVAHG